MTTDTKGLYQKFDVKRRDGSEHKTGQQFFVLSPTHDEGARIALWTYAEWAASNGLDELADDLDVALNRVEAGKPFYPEEG